MSILDKLSTALNQRDEAANIALAEEIAKKKDVNSVALLVETLSNKKLQNDCIKVLYEIGERSPALIKPHLKIFVGLLNSKNNRLQWGGMAALDAITAKDPGAIYNILPSIVDAANKGSVITRDHAVKILIKLCDNKQYAANSFALLKEQLLTCPVNQLPMYAEEAAIIINSSNKRQFIDALQSRMPEMDKEPKKKRIEKVIKKLR